MIDVLYHFTSKHQLPLILKDGFLKLTESQLRPPTPQEIKEMEQGDYSSVQRSAEDLYKPVVWLTDNGSPLNMGLDGSVFNKKEIRITLKMREHYIKWDIWSSKNRADKKWLENLQRNKEHDSWYISEKVIPITGDEIIRIENIVKGEVFIDVPAGIRTYKCAVEPARGVVPVPEYYEFIGKSDLKKGDIIEIKL